MTEKKGTWQLPLGLARDFEAGDFAGVDTEESVRERFLEREGKAGDARMGLFGKGRSARGTCSTTVPNPMIFGRRSLRRSRISRLIALL